jgi:putative two-component system response regulator
MDNTILIIDDTEENIDILVDLLYKEYNLLVALDGYKGLELAKNNKPDLILLDVMMPGINGYEVCKQIKSLEETKNIPVMFLTALSDDKNEANGISIGAIDFIKKPFNPSIVISRIKNYMMIKQYQNKLEDMVIERTRKVEKTKDVIIKAMGVLAEFRDPETGAHIQRTQFYVLALANHLKKHPQFKSYLTDDVIEALFKSAPLHDVGKIAVPDDILQKPGKLSAEEFEVMKKHARQGKLAIESLEDDLPGELFIKYAIEIAFTHHEKWNGTGYPRGIKGEAIPISGRIMALADVYDALISKRVYKPAFTHEAARKIIIEGRGKQFDPILVEAFLELENEFITIAEQYID